MNSALENLSTTPFPWWWRHENNLWTYDESKHTTKARVQWSNVEEDQGPVRISPFVDSGHEQFRTILVTDQWKGPVERSAHAYELIRRANTDHWMLNFLELNLEEQLFLKKTFGDSSSGSPWEAAARCDSPASGFTIAACWNLLHYSDRDLIVTFEHWLQSQRSISGIPEPNQSISLTSRQPLWRLPELIDLDHEEGKHVPKGELELLDEALKLSQGLSDKFWTLLKHSNQRGLRWIGSPRSDRSTQLM